jgi:EpsI family protein
MTRRLLVLIGLVAIAALAREQLRPLAVYETGSLGRVPASIGFWQSGQTTAFTTGVLAQLRVDDYLNRRYVAPDGRWADVYVGYYRVQAAGTSIHSPLHCLPGAGWEPVRADRVAFAGGAARRLLIQKGPQRLFVMYWYQSANRIEGDEYRSRIYTLLDTLRYRRNDAALIRVIVPVGNGLSGEWQAVATAADMARQLEPQIRQQLFPARAAQAPTTP